MDQTKCTFSVHGPQSMNKTSVKFQKDRTKPVRGGGALIKLQYPSFHQRTNSF